MENLQRTIHFELDNFPDASPNPIVRLADVEALPVLFDMLKKQRTVRQKFRVRLLSNFLVISRFAS